MTAKQETERGWSCGLARRAELALVVGGHLWLVGCPVTYSSSHTGASPSARVTNSSASQKQVSAQTTTPSALPTHVACLHHTSRQGFIRSHVRQMKRRTPPYRSTPAERPSSTCPSARTSPARLHRAPHTPGNHTHTPSQATTTRARTLAHAKHSYVPFQSEAPSRTPAPAHAPRHTLSTYWAPTPATRARASHLARPLWHGLPFQLSVRFNMCRLPHPATGTHISTLQTGDQPGPTPQPTWCCPFRCSSLLLTYTLYSSSLQPPRYDNPATPLDTSTSRRPHQPPQSLLLVLPFQ